jgi:excisionase family DNA binding protein
MSTTPARIYRTVSYVAEVFDVSPTTVRRWVRDGEIDAIVSANGRIIRFTDDAIADLTSRLTLAASSKRKGRRSRSS